MKFIVCDSIGKTLQLVILVASSTALLLATAGFAANDWFSSRAQLMSQLLSDALIIGHNTQAALLFDDVEAANRTLFSLTGEGSVVGAAIYDKADRLFAFYQNTSQPLPEKPLPNSQGKYQGLLYAQMPIRAQGELVGSILLLADNSEWQEQQRIRIVMALTLFALSLLWALFISSRLQGLVTRPLLNLTKTARRITQSRDYSLRAEVQSQDEIGLLANDFNAMLNEIQLRDAGLRQAQEQLEDKVAERTKELKLLARRFEHQAFHDALTGLANRVTFDRCLQDGIAHVRLHNESLSVLFLDVDRFKVVNDTLGHGIGDLLLEETAERLKTCLRKGDTLARLGGDEFAVLLVDITPGATGDLAAAMIAEVRRPMQLNGHILQLTASIGISVFPTDGDSADELLKNADTAMYRSKDRGRDRFTFFAPDMNARVERRLILENKLRRAVDESIFTRVYQPKWSCIDQRLIGVEVLLRWLDPEEGEMSPEEFIPLAEECGLIADIDLWVLEHACRDILTLHEQGFDQLQLSVNYSPSHFSRNRASLDVEKALTRTGFPGHRLELEITESLIGPEVDNVLEQLKEVNQLGVEISIDDFGTGYSSLSRLKQLPLHTLKIDRSFIQDLDRNSDDETLVKTIIVMAHNMNLKVVAEGVETAEQYDFVCRHGCDVVQGYRFGKPVVLQELLEMAQRQNRAPEMISG